MKKLIISLIILILVVLTIIVVFNSKNETNNKENGKINIVTTIYPVYDFAKEIAGDKANVSMLLAPGVEIHDYEPTPQDIIKIGEADAFMFLGQELEPWAESVISGFDNKDNLKDVAKGIELTKIEEHDHEENEEHGEYDTHIWLDISKSIEIVKNITDNLCEIDKENEQYYRNRQEEYIKKLQDLDMNFAKVVEQGKRKKIAFGGPFSYAYFIKKYELSYISAYDSCGEGSEPSVNTILEVIEEIKNDKLPVIFYKELSSGNIVKTISEETGAEALEFNSLHSITKAQLDRGVTYLELMNKNLENLQKALQ